MCSASCFAKFELLMTRALVLNQFPRFQVGTMAASSPITYKVADTLRMLIRSATLEVLNIAYRHLLSSCRRC